MRSQPDAPSVPRQVLSGLKISAALAAATLLLLVVVQFIPLHRIQAYVWHVRHGVSVHVGSYRFPVPRQWYVVNYSATDVMLIDLNTGDSISVRTGSMPGRSALESWLALDRSPMPNSNTKILDQKDMRVGDEMFVCIEKNVNSKAIRLYPIDCRSENGLEVTFQPYLFSAKDHDQMFYSLLRLVQKL